MFFTGGDFEIGLLGKKMGMKYAHVNFNAYSQVPKTIKELFNQRKRWWAGAFRHTIINFWETLKLAPLYSVYLAVFVYLCYPLRWTMFIYRPLIYFLLLYPISLIILYVVSGLKRPPWILLLFPFYGLMKTTFMFLPLFGVVEWIRNYRKTGVTGKFLIEKVNEKAKWTR